MNKTHNCNGFCAVKWQNLLRKRKTHLAFKEATISLSLSIQFVGSSQCFDRPNQDDRPVVCRSIVVNLPRVIITKSAFVCTTIFFYCIDVALMSEFTRAQQISFTVCICAAVMIAMNDDRWFSYVVWFVHCRTLWLFKWLSLGSLPSNTNTHTCAHHHFVSIHIVRSS